MTARADWRGPYVLNGRKITTGTSNEQAHASQSLSAAILLALYGDWALRGCLSVIGRVSGVPYTSLVDACTIRLTPW